MKISSKKKVREIVAKTFMWMAMFVVFGLVISVIWTIFSKGVKAMSWDMVSKLPGGGFYIGKEGGFLNAIVGSLYIVGASTVLGLIVSIPVVFFLNVYLQRDSKLAYAARMAFDVLFGVPSIVYGAFGFTIMIYFGLRTSLLGGIIVITLLIIPIFIRTMDEATRNFPRDILDASFALGATRWETLKVVLRQIAPGIATATLLSVGRAIGDAASVMFTAGYTDSIPTSLSQPAATLPLAVFFQLQSPIPEVVDRAYAAALVLTVIVLVLSIASRFITNRFSKNKI
ncbi:MAG: phosphate ABC transporter permease PstA [Bacteroidales bacterium]|jgi:phosphate transport system permease protein|nr:phosphate ABC transporter permease PstA [Bacteroidales bacterium]MBR4646678.1 phosphate ABC transporter permease PstA [Bacteroidales bacterium]MCR4874006.1 phosphate ABC transporter permease PstA [Bacteroidales bacterium]MDD6185230.1 phosphate ABC transporter permease PstA [Bacteroidales bacterium]